MSDERFEQDEKQNEDVEAHKRHSNMRKVEAKDEPAPTPKMSRHIVGTRACETSRPRTRPATTILMMSRPTAGRPSLRSTS